MAKPARAQALADVREWLLLLNNDLEPATVRRISDTDLDMVVVDYLPSQPHHANYPITETLAALRRKPDGGRRLVLAYLNVGQAEDYRTYWQKNWRRGNPNWILMDDPDGWAGNFPVAYWRPEWQAIVRDLASKIAQAGFDGVYLDWVAGYQEPIVQRRASRDRVDPQAEMTRLVQAVRIQARQAAPDFLIIPQNPGPLATNHSFQAAFDGVAQESIWMTWAAGSPGTEGDCPVPRTASEAQDPAFIEALPRRCRQARDSDSGSAMRFAGEEEHLPRLSSILKSGKPVFTVDYALDGAHRARIAERARLLGFKPFMGRKALNAVE